MRTDRRTDVTGSYCIFYLYIRKYATMHRKHCGLVISIHSSVHIFVFSKHRTNLDQIKRDGSYPENHPSKSAPWLQVLLTLLFQCSWVRFLSSTPCLPSLFAGQFTKNTPSSWYVPPFSTPVFMFLLFYCSFTVNILVGSTLNSFCS